MEVWRLQRSLRLLLLAALLAASLFEVRLDSRAQAQAGPAIHDIQDNLAQYGGRIPAYEKLELTFQVDTAAANLQLPYDPAPPPGVQPGVGVSVQALFTPDNWQTTYTQPAFYYQYYDDQVKDGQEWYYPTGAYAWKVRFSPNRPGVWQYRLTAQDARGASESSMQTFTVAPSTDRGFVRVSARDLRYFEFDSGDYFPALGYNMNFNHLSWVNPVLDNREAMEQMSKNGIQLVRIWLSQWGIYGPSWNPWNTVHPDLSAAYIPPSQLTFATAYPGSEVSMELEPAYSPCMFTGFLKASPAVKRNTAYRVRVRYQAQGLAGPREAGAPWGFAAKVGGWLAGEGAERCDAPGTGTKVTPLVTKDSNGWQILEGRWESGERDFLPNFYLALENVTGGQVNIDYVWIEEELPGGGYGPNIVSKPWMAQHLYMEQRNSYAFDKLLELAEDYNVYLRPVIMEKNDFLFNRIDFEGNPIPDDPRCYDQIAEDGPAECPGNGWFYGNWRAMTKVRWLQQAWWRYLQARWGYSTRIHSWELLNEGDPYSTQHYTLADEFGKYMRQFAPDNHLVSTSTWHSFPKDEFWANPEYPNVDFADIHRYFNDGEALLSNTAAVTEDASLAYGAKQPGGAGKPVIRGELGFVKESGGPDGLFSRDKEGIWLHNLIWGGLNPGGLIESYWYENRQIYKASSDGKYQFDYRPEFRAYRNFIDRIPLSNGRYQDAVAQVSSKWIGAWGQKDLVGGRAHLWIFNQAHTWRNVVNGSRFPPASATVSLQGFQPGRAYTLQWWDTYQPDPARQILKTQTVAADGDGVLAFTVDGLKTDTAALIFPRGEPPKAAGGGACLDFYQALRGVSMAIVQQICQ